MIKTIDHFSINDLFWIQIKDHFISFSIKGLPTDIHFTIGFDKRSPDINLHITKNTEDPTNKPKITIVSMDKTIIEQDVNFLALILINKILQPFDINEHKNKYDYNLGYISFENLQNSDSSSVIEQSLINCLKNISKIKSKTRLKINGDIESRLENLVQSQEIQSTIFKNIVDLTDQFTTLTDAGIILTKDNTFQVLRLYDKWYTIRTDIQLIDLVALFVGSDLAKKLIYKTKRALEKIKNSSTFEETRHLNKPIRLIRKRKKDKIQL